jgi:hypothetical protein
MTPRRSLIEGMKEPPTPINPDKEKGDSSLIPTTISTQTMFRQ